MIRTILICLFFLLPTFAWANDNSVNVFIWGGEIPDAVIQKFTHETGIKVNLSTYETNEAMYAKLRATPQAHYDVIQPSGYYVERMARQGLLTPLDKHKLPNQQYIEPKFTHSAYDTGNHFSVPYVWGITGIFVNRNYFKISQAQSWSQLYNHRFKNQLLLLDDPREVFSMTLLDLGYPANDENPQHIKKAYKALKRLWPNIKVFNSDAVISIASDEDATAGMIWNGDLLKSQQVNSQLSFIYPQEGFVIWVDTFAIPTNALHKNNAYKFINFMLRPDIAAEASITVGYATANQAARALMPDDIRNNPIIYPNNEVLARGQVQRDVSDETLALYEKYWEELKL